jgi:hypothetical protein
MSFSLARLNMIIVITRSPFGVKSIRDLASPILIPKLTNTSKQIFKTHRTKLCTVLPERINQTINLISRLNNKEFMNVKHK